MTGMVRAAAIVAKLVSSGWQNIRYHHSLPLMNDFRVHSCYPKGLPSRELSISSSSNFDVRVSTSSMLSSLWLKGTQAG